MNPIDPFTTTFGADSGLTLGMATVEIGSEESPKDAENVEDAATTVPEATELPNRHPENATTDGEENSKTESEEDHTEARRAVDSQVQDNEEEKDEEEMQDEDPEWGRIWRHMVDLVALEEKCGRAPVFTRGLLSKIREQRDRIRELLREPEAKRLKARSAYIDWKAPDGRVHRVWKDVYYDYDTLFVDVLYVTRVELDEGFRKDVGHLTFQQKRLRKYNDISDGDRTYIDAPYAFNTFDYRSKRDEHEDPQLMAEWQSKLKTAAKSWVNSESWRQLEKTMIGAAVISASIRKVVCFGLGSFRFSDQVYSQPALQHIAVFYIAITISKLYGPADQTIEILLQDPGYVEKDRILLRDLHQRINGDNGPTTLSFVDDPDGLLAIDANTLIVAVFLPCAFPLLQLMADLFQSATGPACIFSDVNGRTFTEASYLENGMYNHCATESPAVARMLTEHYMPVHDGFDDPTIDASMIQEGNQRKYWLERNAMDLCVRKVGRYSITTSRLLVLEHYD